LPGTIIVEEKIPPGASGVLINQRHTDTDIYLPVNQEEMQLVEAIDGQRTTAEIMDSVAIEQLDGVRTFFQNLWWYDQISFDASKGAS
jgi:hypothetical protein